MSLQTVLLAKEGAKAAIAWREARLAKQSESE